MREIISEREGHFFGVAQHKDLKRYLGGFRELNERPGRIEESSRNTPKDARRGSQPFLSQESLQG